MVRAMERRAVMKLSAKCRMRSSRPRSSATGHLPQSSVIGTGSIGPSAQSVSSQPEMTASTSWQIGQWTWIRLSFCHDPHPAGARLVAWASFAPDKRLPSVKRLERASVLDEADDAERLTKKARVLGREVAILVEPVVDVHDEGHVGLVAD